MLMNSFHYSRQKKTAAKSFFCGLTVPQRLVSDEHDPVSRFPALHSASSSALPAACDRPETPHSSGSRNSMSVAAHPLAPVVCSAARINHAATCLLRQRPLSHAIPHIIALRINENCTLPSKSLERSQPLPAVAINVVWPMFYNGRRNSINNRFATPPLLNGVISLTAHR